MFQMWINVNQGYKFHNYQIRIPSNDKALYARVCYCQTTARKRGVM